MAIVQERNLNMIPDSTPVIVRVDQYDTGTGRLVAHLFAGDKMYTPAAGSTATIQGTKPDMHGFAYDAVLEDATVTADLTQQMSCVAGNTRCQFVVVEPTGRTGTFCFVLKVQESALSDDTDISETELPAIIDAAQKNAEKAEENAEKAEENAEKAEEAVTHYPYINMETLHWIVWDAEAELWVDTDIVAKGSKYDAGTGIKIAEDVISIDLIAGENVQIEGATISATDTTYDPATQTTAGLMSAGDKAKLDGIEAGAEVNVQADYAQTNTAADDYIKNKPTLGTAAAKNATNAVTAGSTDLVESGAVKTAIDTAIASAYKPAGSKTCAELTSALLVVANYGNVYNMSDSGTTTADFVEGAGHPIRQGDNVGIVKVNNVYKFDILSGFVDTSGFQTKTISGTVEGQNTVEGALGALSTNKQPKTLSTPITVDGVQKTTVEGAVDAINDLAAGNKAAIADIKDGQNIDSFADVESALANKQDALGLYIDDDGYICQN